MANSKGFCVSVKKLIQYNNKIEFVVDALAASNVPTVCILNSAIVCQLVRKIYQTDLGSLISVVLLTHNMSDDIS